MVPSVQYLDGGHGEHCEADSKFFDAPNVPFGQFVGECDASVQNDPNGHSWG